ncbi:MAG: amino acid ABC transporter permease [Lachnospiraceae bacterium]|nr:amino acid ABC transporter permease [Lachnospiraceae bacterium]
MSLQVMLEQLADGMLKSMGIFFLTLLFSLPLGLIIAFGRMSKNIILRSFTGMLISILRGTPLMLQLMVVYFFPFYLFGWSIAGWRFPAIIVGFSVNYAAYFAEIYRSGIEAIPKGQYEAAQLLNYSKVQTFFRIILPQVIKIILPAMTNEIITLVKDTSLAFSLAYLEMFTIAKQIAARETTFVPFVIAAIFYYVFNLLVAFVMKRLEKRMNYYS